MHALYDVKLAGELHFLELFTSDSNHRSILRDYKLNYSIKFALSAKAILVKHVVSRKAYIRKTLYSLSMMAVHTLVYANYDD